MKKFFLFLLSIIVLSCCVVVAGLKLDYITKNDVRNVIDKIYKKTATSSEKVSKKVGDTLEQTKSGIQEQIRQQIDKKPREVKIVATLGKEGWKNIPSYCENGANIFRINGSHIKSEKQLQEMLDGIKNYINDPKCKNAEIMYDTQGPEIRILINSNNTKNVKNKKIKKVVAQYQVKSGDNIVLHTNLADKEINFVKDPVRDNGQNKTIHAGVNYKEFLNDVKENMTITIENRIVYAKVENIDLEKGLVKLVITEVNTKDGNYKISDRRHINLIGKPVSQETLTIADKKYIQMSVLNGVSYYAISFVRNKDDIQEVKNIIKQTLLLNNSKMSEEEMSKKMNEIKVIAKFETQQGMDNIDDILNVSEGGMIARGDLGAEIAFEEVPYATFKIMKVCEEKNKFSILATDVLLSLFENDMVSRNDAYVIACSLNKGIDAIMLSNETSVDVNKGNKSIKELKKHIDYYNKRKANKDY